MNKKKYGQFFTKNKDYILRDMFKDMPSGICECIFVDPFAGEGDLLEWISSMCGKKNTLLEAFDIDPKLENIILRNTLLDPLNLKDKYVITNPPYLAKNKTKNKEVFERYNTDDLYKASIKMIMGYDFEDGGYSDKGCKGGILIVPVNFFSDRDWKLRESFFKRYKIISLNIFEENVFKDTTYTVCSFNFRKIKNNEDQKFKIRIYPKYLKDKVAKNRGYSLMPTLTEFYKYTIGYEFFRLIKDRSLYLKVGRLAEDTKLDNWFISRLYLRAIDTGSMSGRIKLIMRKQPFVGKISERTHATVLLSKKFLIKEQMVIVEKFNEILEEYRTKFYSLFLTNFRNSTSNYARKRIDFKMAFDLISHIGKKYLNK